MDEDQQSILKQIDDLCSLPSTRNHLSLPFGSSDRKAAEKKIETLTLMNNLFRKLDNDNTNNISSTSNDSRLKRVQCATLFVSDYHLWSVHWQQAVTTWLSQLSLKEERLYSFCTLCIKTEAKTDDNSMVVEIEYNMEQFNSIQLSSIAIVDIDTKKKSTFYVTSTSYMEEDSLDNFFSLYSKIACVGGILPFSLWIDLVRNIILSLTLLSFSPEDKIADKLISCHRWFIEDKDSTACTCRFLPNFNVYYAKHLTSSIIADDLAKITIADNNANDTNNGWISVVWDRLLINRSDHKHLTNRMKNQVPKRVFESIIKSSCGQQMVHRYLAKTVAKGMLVEVNKYDIGCSNSSLSINISTITCSEKFDKYIRMHYHQHLDADLDDNRNTIAFQFRAYGTPNPKIDLRLESPYAYETDIVNASKRIERYNLNQLLLSRGKKPQARKLKSDLSPGRSRLPDTMVGGYHNEVIYFLKLYVLTVIEVLIELSTNLDQTSGQSTGQNSIQDFGRTTLGDLSKIDQVIPLPGPLIGIIFDYTRDEDRLEELDDLILLKIIVMKSLERMVE